MAEAMEPTLIVLLIFVGLLIAMIFGVCIAYCYSKKKRNPSAYSPKTIQTEEASGPANSKQQKNSLVTKTQSASAEIIDNSPTLLMPKEQQLKAYKGSGDRSIVTAIKTRSANSLPEKSQYGRMKMKQFKVNGGTHKRFTRIPEGPLMHSYTHVPRNHSLVPKILLKEIKGDITVYSPDFSVNLPLLASARRRQDLIDQYYHLGNPMMDNVMYRRKINDARAIPEPWPAEGNHEKVKNMVEGTPFLEIKPHLAKMPAMRDDTTRHFIINTQYAARIAIRFKCESGRFVSIPNHEIIEPCGRLRVVIAANSDMDEQAEKEVVYYEYIQVPERAMEAQQEFMKRPVIGRITLRLFPCILNVSPNTFYPSTRRRTTIYTSTLTNSGKSPCKFIWPDERDVIVSPQNGFIKPQSSVQFTFTLKRPATTAAIVAEMKYSLNDRQGANGVIVARFETVDMKRLIQVSTKALAACDTAEDPGYIG
ncbi:hypothetical protein PRIPAC_84831 [Pristionchus pacificus]|uniref:MSP domain-containing protein n=1 Tax=Pristionchus pacificus TaxID=54126 RepID=A0A2A6BLB1_PRIPA|nr:hypothetical protein PRIPAC_84831 [Pristionchus pacificus]|eukprot:PDM66603.1 MSP domain-containing protein [Pristionchus pacificus]